MKQIEAFIDDIYHSVGGNKKDIQELKVEMKNHLLEAVHELLAEGKTEREAIEIAIERFGGEKEMRSIVSQLFKAQKTFAKWILVMAMAFLITSGTLLAGATIKETKMVNIENSTFNQIAGMIENKDSLTPSMQEEIKSLVQYKDNIKSVKITDLKNSTEGAFEYDKQVMAPKWLYSYYHNGSTDDKWSFYMEIQRFNDFVFISLLAGIAVYWTLFTVWATVNAYHRKRLNTGWIIVFAVFNVLGYLIYGLVGRMKRFNKG